ncbi:MAG: hypothetical protein AAGC67_06460 [Myxococcota bacterium]
MRSTPIYILIVVTGVAMMACTLLGEALAGHVMVRSSGLGEAPEDRRAFRAWVSKLAEGVAFPDYPDSDRKDGERSDPARGARPADDLASRITRARGRVDPSSEAETAAGAAAEDASGAEADDD